jgi:hypothetical protein
MNDRVLRSRLRHAFLLALLTPPVACGGATFVSGSDEGGSSSGGPDGSSGDATSSGSSGGGSGSGSGSGGGSGGGSGSSSGSSGGSGSSSGGDASVFDAGCGAGHHIGDAGVCMFYVTPPCDYDGGTLSSTECQALCQKSPGSCFGTMYEGAEVIECTTCVTGRRPTRERGLAARDGSAGDFFARCSWLEAAAVHAFRRLARELTTHGAPARLVARARVAARDEVRHTRVTAELARRFGGRPRRPAGRRLPVRQLEAIARENAVEGCVRETYGALVAMWQARRASDPAVASTLGRIARDESRHASIAWQVAAWVEPRLGASARARIEQARRDALVELRAELASDPPADVVRRAGMPTAAQAACLLDAMVQSVPGV